MIKTICDILGCTRRRQLHKELSAEITAQRELLEKQRKIQARLADEDDWFKNVCIENFQTQEVCSGCIKNPLPVHLDS